MRRADRLFQIIQGLHHDRAVTARHLKVASLDDRYEFVAGRTLQDFLAQCETQTTGE